MKMKTIIKETPASTIPITFCDSGIEIDEAGIDGVV
jgi:hypothetical protein